jgi:hypothetical protein
VAARNHSDDDDKSVCPLGFDGDDDDDDDDDEDDVGESGKCVPHRH